VDLLAYPCVARRGKRKGGLQGEYRTKNVPRIHIQQGGPSGYDRRAAITGVFKRGE